jgi:hypothetical protein
MTDCSECENFKPKPELDSVVLKNHATIRKLRRLLEKSSGTHNDHIRISSDGSVFCLNCGVGVNE